jgi:hypothetical protein
MFEDACRRDYRTCLSEKHFPPFGVGPETRSPLTSGMTTSISIEHMEAQRWTRGRSSDRSARVGEESAEVGDDEVGTLKGFEVAQGWIRHERARLQPV